MVQQQPALLDRLGDSPATVRMSPAELEAQRRTAVTEGIAATKSVVVKPELCISPRAIAGAWEKLQRTQKTDPEWGEAQRLTVQLEGCRKKAEAAEIKGLQTAQALLRKEWASKMERNALDSGMDMSFRLSSPVNDRLTVHWVLMGKVAVHKITNGGSMDSRALLGQAQALGIRRVTFTDGHDYRTYYDLEPVPANAMPTSLGNLRIARPLVLK